MRAFSNSVKSIVSWSPLRKYSRYFVSSTVGEKTLNIYSFDFTGPETKIVVKKKYDLLSEITCLEWNTLEGRESGYVITGHRDGKILLHDFDKTFCHGSQCTSMSPITHINVNPTHTNIYFSVSADKTLRVWDLKENIPSVYTSQPNLTTHNITGAKWGRTDSSYFYIALSDSSGLASIYDVRSLGQSSIKIADPKSKTPLSDIAFSPSRSEMLVTASSDPKNSVVQVWDLRNSGRPVGQLNGHFGGVTSLEWPKYSENILVSSDSKGNVYVWDLEKYAKLASTNTKSSIHAVRCSCFMTGAVLVCSDTTDLYSFADPSIGCQVAPSDPYYLNRSGIDVSFDGKVFHYYDDTIKSFSHEEKIGEISEFSKLVSALEEDNLGDYISDKVKETQSDVEKRLLEYVSISLDKDGFKETILNKIGIKKNNIVKNLEKQIGSNISDKNMAHSANELFGAAPATQVSVFGFTPTFNFFDQPFRVLPDGDDEEGCAIANSMINGDIKSAVELAFSAGRYAEAILIASCGPRELFEATTQKYLRLNPNPLNRIVSAIMDNDLESFVSKAETVDWKEIFAVICYYGGDKFSDLCAQLGRRLIVDNSDYDSALVCFVSANDYEMIQESLFKIYQKALSKDPSSIDVVLLVLEKLIAISGDKAGSVVAPLAESFIKNVVQSGHKEMAIRFLNALPDNRSLAGLKSAISGDSSARVQNTKKTSGHEGPGKLNVQQQRKFQPGLPTQSTNQPDIQHPGTHATVNAPPQNMQFNPTSSQPFNPSSKQPYSIPPSQPFNPAQSQPFNPNQSKSYDTASGVFVPDRNPSAVPAPGGSDVRQKGRSSGYRAPPPPKASEIQNSPIPQNGPLPSTPQMFANNQGSSAPFQPSQTQYYQPAPSLISGQYNQFGQSQAPAPPPPQASSPVINVPPSVQIVAPVQTTSHYGGQNIPGQHVQGYPGQQASRPPPPPPPPEPSPEASIDEVPSEYMSLAEGLRDLIDEIYNNGSENPEVKKAAESAETKLPFIYGYFRNGHMNPELVTLLKKYLESVQSNDTQYKAIRKSIASYIKDYNQLCTCISYITSALDKFYN